MVGVVVHYSDLVVAEASTLEYRGAFGSEADVVL